MQELEDEIYEKLEELRQRELQNSELMQKFEQIEDETYRQARKAKEINDALFDAYAKDKRLISLLTEKEEELHQKQILDRLFCILCGYILNKCIRIILDWLQNI